MASSTSPDIEWVVHTLRELERSDRTFEVWALLRPTSPLRSAESIATAVRQLVARGDAADSIRAVEKVKQHPGKMWVLEGELHRPAAAAAGARRPDALAPVPGPARRFTSRTPRSRSAGSRVALSGGGLSGTRVMPWWPPGSEGLSVDYPEDWERLERLVDLGEAALPEIQTRHMSDRVSP